MGRTRRRRDGDGRREPVLDARGGSSRRPARVPAARPARARRRRPLVFRLVSWGLTLSLWAVIALFAVTGYVFVGLDKQGLFQVPEREPGIILLAADGNLVAERGSFFGDAVRIDELPSYVPQAVIAIEDRRYYSHFGIDPIGITRAAYANFRAGRTVEGGSTLTQQLAKNLFLKPERTYERKFQELVLALWLERKYSKDEILQLYLNRVYYGAGAVGVEKAAQKYFGKSARDITLSEAAILAAVLKAPTTYNPITQPERAAQRAREVIKDMVESGFITRDEAEAAASIEMAVKPSDYVPATQYIVDWVGELLPQLIGKVDASIVVETTLDRALQDRTEKAVRDELTAQGKKLAVSQGAMVVMDTTGAVRAMVGGRSYIKSQFNRVVKAKRQPGSAFKPFVYLAAVERGLSPETTRVDEPVQFGDWSPENYRRKYLGPVSLRKALALSLNTISAKLTMEAGPDTVAATAQRLGIASPMQANASIALGTSEVSLLELTAAFVPFANGGSAVLPHIVTRITTRDGQVLYERRGDGVGQVVSDVSLGAMNNMLLEVVNSGTGRAARIEGHEVAGKTGTSQDYRDGWFIGYTSHLIAGVWVGNDDNSPTNKVTGGGLPTAIWHDVMAPVHQELAAVPLPGVYGPGHEFFDGPADTVPPPVAAVEPPPVRTASETSGGGFGGLFRSIFGGGGSGEARQPRRVGDDERTQRMRQRNLERQMNR